MGKMLDGKRITGQHLGPYLRNVDVQWNRVNIDNLPVMDFDPSERERFRLRHGDVLVCEGGEVGRTALWRDELDECYFQKAIHRLRPLRVGEDPRFLCYVMRAAAETGVLAAGGNPNTIDHLTAVRLRHTRFPFPPHPEQRGIADFLDRETAKIDALLAAKRSADRLGEEQRQGIVDAAVTGRLGTLERCRAPAQLSWLHSIPITWGVRPLKTIARVQTGVALGRTFEGVRTVMVPYIRVANVQDGYLDLSDVAEMEIPGTEVDRYRLRKGDLLMNEGGDFDKLGRGAVWNAPMDPCIHQNHVFAVRPHDPEDVAWLELFNRSTAARHFFILRSKQSTNLASVSSSNLKQLPVVWPPRPERRRLVATVRDHLAAIDARAALSTRSIELLREHRSALITAAVTGQIDVSQAVSRSP